MKLVCSGQLCFLSRGVWQAAVGYDDARDTREKQR